MMDNSTDQCIQAPRGRRIARKSRQIAKVEHKRQADLQDSGIDNGGDDAGLGGDAKGKGNEAKGKGKAGPAGTGPPGNPPAQPPGPPPEPASAQPPGPGGAPPAPAIAPTQAAPPSPPPPTIVQQPPPPPTTEQQPPPPPSTVQQPPPPAATAQQPPPPVTTPEQPPPPATTVEPPPPSSSSPPPPSSSEPPPPPIDTSSPAPPSLPPALPVLTTSLVISTTLAVDSSTSIQTSFITITQSTVFKQESIVTPPASLKPLPSVLEPSFYNTIVSDLTTSSPTSTSFLQSPTFGPTSPTDGTGNTRQTVPADSILSPTAKHLLLALGVMGVVSLFITAAIILMRRSRRKIIYRVDERSASPDVPFQGRAETYHGVTTEITAAPRALSFFQRSRSETTPITQPRLSIMKHGEAMGGAMSVPNNPSLPQPSEGRTFSEALNSFMEKARNSSYSYKVGP